MTTVGGIVVVVEVEVVVGVDVEVEVVVEVLVVEVEVATLDSKGNPVKIVLQIDTSSDLYLDIANQVGAFYIDPSLPHLTSGLIRTGDIFGLTVNGPVSEIDNANGKEIKLYAPANISLYVNTPWMGAIPTLTPK